MENKLNDIYGEEPIENENSFLEKIENKTIVKQNNVFIRATNQTKLSTNEKKILTYLLCNLKDNKECIIKENEIYYKINISKSEMITKLYGDKKGKWNTKLVKDFNEIKNRNIQYFEDNGNTIVLTDIIFENKINAYKDEMIIYFNKKIANDFIKFAEERNYTRYFLETFIKLNNKYAQRMYEIFCSYRSLAKQNKENKLIYILKIERENFYKIFLENENSYKRFYDLQRRVIEPARKNININTDINVEFEKVGLDLQFTIDFTNNDFSKENELIAKGIEQKELKKQEKEQLKELKEKSKELSTELKTKKTKTKTSKLKGQLDNKEKKEDYNQVLIDSISSPDFK